MSNFDLTDGIIDVRDIIERFKELESDLEDFHDEQEITLSFEYALQDVANFPGLEDEHAEYGQLKEVLEELKGNGGDEQWRGDWYPVTLINENYFEQAMDELLEEIGDIPRDIPGYLRIVVDYDALKMDYTSIDIGDETYWYR